MTAYSLGALLHEGKAKRVFATDQADLVAVEFKDDATAFNAQKKPPCRARARSTAASRP